MIGLVERAEGYRLIGLGLRYPDPPDLRAGFAEVEGADGPVGAFSGLAALVDDDLPGEYNRLFNTSVAVPPYESAYLPVDKGVTMGQLAALYEAFGMKVGGAERELADHVGTEVEFMSALCLMEALALQDGDAERAALIASARRVFAEEHLGRWLPVFAQKLSDRAAHSFYARLAGHAAAWIERDLADHAWTADSPRPPRLEVIEEEVVCPVGAKAEAGV